MKLHGRGMGSHCQISATAIALAIAAFCIATSHAQTTLDPTDVVCRQILCSNNCTGVCGWSSTQSMCRAGAFTRQDELNLGVCGPTTSTAATASPVLATTVATVTSAAPTSPQSTTCNGVSDARDCIVAFATLPRPSCTDLLSNGERLGWQCPGHCPIYCPAATSAPTPCNPGTPPPDVCVNRLDLAFLIDGSSSLTDTDWNSSLSFVNQLIEPRTVGSDSMRVAVTAFATNVTVVTTFSTGQNKTNVQNAVSALVQPGGGTRTSTAIAYVDNNIFVAAAGMRSGVERLLVVITDGTSNLGFNPTTAAAALRTQKDVRVLAIGVGSLVDGTELQNIATSSSDVYRVSDFSALSAVVDNISSTVCQPAPEQPTLCPTPVVTQAPTSTPRDCFGQDDVPNCYAQRAAGGLLCGTLHQQRQCPQLCGLCTAAPSSAAPTSPTPAPTGVPTQSRAPTAASPTSPAPTMQPTSVAPTPSPTTAAPVTTSAPTTPPFATFECVDLTRFGGGNIGNSELLAVNVSSTASCSAQVADLNSLLRFCPLSLAAVKCTSLDRIQGYAFLDGSCSLTGAVSNKMNAMLAQYTLNTPATVHQHNGSNVFCGIASDFLEVPSSSCQATADTLNAAVNSYHNNGLFATCAFATTTATTQTSTTQTATTMTSTTTPLPRGQFECVTPSGGGTSSVIGVDASDNCDRQVALMNRLLQACQAVHSGVYVPLTCQSLPLLPQYSLINGACSTSLNTVSLLNNMLQHYTNASSGGDGALGCDATNDFLHHASQGCQATVDTMNNALDAFLDNGSFNQCLFPTTVTSTTSTQSTMTQTTVTFAPTAAPTVRPLLGCNGVFDPPDCSTAFQTTPLPSCSDTLANGALLGNACPGHCPAFCPVTGAPTTVAPTSKAPTGAPTFVTCSGVADSGNCNAQAAAGLLRCTSELQRLQCPANCNTCPPPPTAPTRAPSAAPSPPPSTSPTLVPTTRSPTVAPTLAPTPSTTTVTTRTTTVTQTTRTQLPAAFTCVSTNPLNAAAPRVIAATASRQSCNWLVGTLNALMEVCTLNEVPFFSCDNVSYALLTPVAQVLPGTLLLDGGCTSSAAGTALNSMLDRFTGTTNASAHVVCGLTLSPLVQVSASTCDATVSTLNAAVQAFYNGPFRTCRLETTTSTTTLSTTTRTSVTQTSVTQTSVTSTTATQTTTVPCSDLRYHGEVWHLNVSTVNNCQWFADNFLCQATNAATSAGLGGLSARDACCTCGGGTRDPNAIDITTTSATLTTTTATATTVTVTETDMRSTTAPPDAIRFAAHANTTDFLSGRSGRLPVRVEYNAATTDTVQLIAVVTLVSRNGPRVGIVSGLLFPNGTTMSTALPTSGTLDVVVKLGSWTEARSDYMLTVYLATSTGGWSNRLAYTATVRFGVTRGATTTSPTPAAACHDVSSGRTAWNNGVSAAYGCGFFSNINLCGADAGAPGLAGMVTTQACCACGGGHRTGNSVALVSFPSTVVKPATGSFRMNVTVRYGTASMSVGSGYRLVVVIRNPTDAAFSGYIRDVTLHDDGSEASGLPGASVVHLQATLGSWTAPMGGYQIYVALLANGAAWSDRLATSPTTTFTVVAAAGAAAGSLVSGADTHGGEVHVGAGNTADEHSVVLTVLGVAATVALVGMVAAVVTFRRSQRQRRATSTVENLAVAEQPAQDRLWGVTAL
eukprot:m.49022 g.49022  ORF g.49022 m.49022 type:complete len:1684 (-) comp7070_c0_seq1:3358-8409(-)